jgi:Kef-type K+ transport system membrane component KefB
VRVIVNHFYAVLVGGVDNTAILLSLFVALLAAKLAAELFERIRQPAVVGEIIAGIIIGPAVLNLVQPSETLDALAEIGVIFLLFTVGLETRPSDIFKVGRTATLVAVLGVAVPFAAGWGLLSLWPGHSWIEALFVGAAMVATSVGITARVLSGMRLISAEASRIILAAAVIDDVIGLLVLAIVTGLSKGGLNYIHIGILATLAVGFTVLVVVFGTHAVERVRHPIRKMKIDHSLLMFAVVLCFGLAAVANLIGIAGIVGAFLAGVALSEINDEPKLHQQSKALSEFTAPFFLIAIGMKLNLAAFREANVILLTLTVVALAMITKLIGCGLGAARLGRRRALQVGVGMIPRGEVGIVVAQIGLAMAAVSDVIYGVVLAMAVITTLAAPPFIKLAFANEHRTQQPTEYEAELQQDIG